MNTATEYWHILKDGRVQCDLCPRYCRLREGQRGLCFIRQNQQQKVVLTSYGKAHGFCIDPIEKKPLNHFLPGTPVLSFGTAGCNLTCKFCQNWDMSKSRDMQTLARTAAPELIARMAKQSRCRSIAYTYNDPVIFMEYALDTAAACKEKDIYSVAVTAGYIDAKPREVFFAAMDAANIDLKAFSERFYKKICGGELQNVLETLCYLKQETPVWFELTTLLIEEENDSEKELHAMSQWVVENLGKDIPWHFTAFHPDWKMRDKSYTATATLLKARDIALQYGLHYVYTGNVHDEQTGSTWCLQCGNKLIGRDWYVLTDWNLEQGRCNQCQAALPGFFEARQGNWGAKRLPLNPEFGPW